MCAFDLTHIISCSGTAICHGTVMELCILDATYEVTCKHLPDHCKAGTATTKCYLLVTRQPHGSAMKAFTGRAACLIGGQMSIALGCMQAVCGTEQVSYQGQVLDLEKPFKRATMHELVQEALGQSLVFTVSHIVLESAENSILTFDRVVCFRLLLAPIPLIIYFVID